MHIAAASGDLDGLGMLLLRGGNINEKEDAVSSPTTFDVVSMLSLLKHAHSAQSGRTPLHWAAALKRIVVGRYLCETRADVKACDKVSSLPASSDK